MHVRCVKYSYNDNNSVDCKNGTQLSVNSISLQPGMFLDTLQDDIQLCTSMGITSDLVRKIYIDIVIENEICRHECIICSDDLIFNANGLLFLDFFSEYACKINVKEKRIRGKCCREGSEKASHVLGLAGVCVRGSHCNFEGGEAPVKYKDTSIQCKIEGSGAPVFVNYREVEGQCSVVGERCPERCESFREVTSPYFRKCGTGVLGKSRRQDAMKVKGRRPPNTRRAPVKLEPRQKAITTAALQSNDRGQKLNPRVKGNLQSFDGGTKPGSRKMATNMTLHSRGHVLVPTTTIDILKHLREVQFQCDYRVLLCEITCRGMIEAPEFCEEVIESKGTGKKIVMSRSLCKMSKTGCVPLINESEKFIQLERNLEVRLASTLSNVAETTGGIFVVSSKRKLSGNSVP
ncbi:hypothetical protein PR048_011086, partial [Dryococelus australis]